MKRFIILNTVLNFYMYESYESKVLGWHKLMAFGLDTSVFIIVSCLLSCHSLAAEVSLSSALNLVYRESSFFTFLLVGSVHAVIDEDTIELVGLFFVLNS